MLRRTPFPGAIAGLTLFSLCCGPGPAAALDPTAWQGKVEAALTRVEPHQQQLPPAQFGDDAGLVQLAQAERRERQPAREGEAAQPREHDRPDRQRAEGDQARDADRDASEQREEFIRRIQEMRNRMQGQVRGRRSDRSGDAAPAEATRPHPRIVAALQSQQQELEQLTARVERMERQLRQLNERVERQPERDRPQPEREIDRPRRPRDVEERNGFDRAVARDRAERQAREQLRSELDLQREKVTANRNRWREDMGILQHELEEQRERQRDLRLQREQAERRLQQAQQELVENSKQLHEVERSMAKLNGELAHRKAELNQLDDVLKQLDQRRRDMVNRVDRDAVRAERESERRRETRKPALPHDAI